MLVHSDEVVNGEAGAYHRSSSGLLSSCESDFEGGGRIQVDIQPHLPQPPFHINLQMAGEVRVFKAA
jgi:hypothetical protein